jgi:SAM-dependent methyltransferase
MDDVFSPSVCRFEHFRSDWYARWAKRLGFPDPSSDADPASFHRKMWEFAAILQTLEQRGLLTEGKKGLGFAVGLEPLPAFLAHYGVHVLATDLMADRVDPGWIATGQHSTGLAGLFLEHLDSREEFERKVRFEPADMTDLSTLPYTGEFDFLWSSCAFEHLGSLDRGLDFVVNAMRLLKPGGIAVHTTEFNVSSTADTLTEGSNVVYRRCDMEVLDGRLRALGCGLEQIDYDAGTHLYDLWFDKPPYHAPSAPHIKLDLEGFVSTSMLIVAVKGPSALWRVPTPTPNLATVPVLESPQAIVEPAGQAEPPGLSRAGWRKLLRRRLKTLARFARPRG